MLLSDNFFMNAKILDSTQFYKFDFYKKVVTQKNLPLHWEILLEDALYKQGLDKQKSIFIKIDWQAFSNNSHLPRMRPDATGCDRAQIFCLANFFICTFWNAYACKGQFVHFDELNLFKVFKLKLFNSIIRVQSYSDNAISWSFWK